MDNMQLIPLSLRHSWKSYVEQQINTSKDLSLTLTILQLEIPYQTIGFQNFKQFLDALHIEVKRGAVAKSNPSYTYPSTCVVNIGDEVIYQYNHREENGTVKWLGEITGVICAGIEFTRPTGFPCESSSGLLFPCKPGHARIVPVRDLIVLLQDIPKSNLTAPLTYGHVTSTSTPKTSDMPISSSATSTQSSSLSYVYNAKKKILTNNSPNIIPESEPKKPLNFQMRNPTQNNPSFYFSRADNVANEGKECSFSNLVPKRKWQETEKESGPCNVHAKNSLISASPSTSAIVPPEETLANGNSKENNDVDRPTTTSIENKEQSSEKSVEKAPSTSSKYIGTILEQYNKYKLKKFIRFSEGYLGSFSQVRDPSQAGDVESEDEVDERYSIRVSTSILESDTDSDDNSVSSEDLVVDNGEKNGGPENSTDSLVSRKASFNSDLQNNVSCGNNGSDLDDSKESTETTPSGLSLASLFGHNFNIGSRSKHLLRRYDPSRDISISSLSNSNICNNTTPTLKKMLQEAPIHDVGPSLKAKGGNEKLSNIPMHEQQNVSIIHERYSRNSSPEVIVLGEVRSSVEQQEIMAILALEPPVIKLERVSPPSSPLRQTPEDNFPHAYSEQGGEQTNTEQRQRYPFSIAHLQLLNNNELIYPNKPIGATDNAKLCPYTSGHIQENHRKPIDTSDGRILNSHANNYGTENLRKQIEEVNGPKLHPYSNSYDPQHPIKPTDATNDPKLNPHINGYGLENHRGQIDVPNVYPNPILNWQTNVYSADNPRKPIEPPNGPPLNLHTNAYVIENPRKPIQAATGPPSNTYASGYDTESLRKQIDTTIGSILTQNANVINYAHLHSSKPPNTCEPAINEPSRLMQNTGGHMIANAGYQILHEHPTSTVTTAHPTEVNGYPRNEIRSEPIMRSHPSGNNFNHLPQNGANVFTPNGNAFQFQPPQRPQLAYRQMYRPEWQHPANQTYRYHEQQMLRARASYPNKMNDRNIRGTVRHQYNGHNMRPVRTKIYQEHRLPYNYNAMLASNAIMSHLNVIPQQIGPPLIQESQEGNSLPALSNTAFSPEFAAATDQTRYHLKNPFFYPHGTPQPVFQANPTMVEQDNLPVNQVNRNLSTVQVQGNISMIQGEDTSQVVQVHCKGINSQKASTIPDTPTVSSTATCDSDDEIEYLGTFSASDEPKRKPRRRGKSEVQIEKTLDHNIKIKIEKCDDSPTSKSSPQLIPVKRRTTRSSTKAKSNSTTAAIAASSNSSSFLSPTGKGNGNRIMKEAHSHASNIIPSSNSLIPSEKLAVVCNENTIPESPDAATEEKDAVKNVCSTNESPKAVIGTKTWKVPKEISPSNGFSNAGQLISNRSNFPPDPNKPSKKRKRRNCTATSDDAGRNLNEIKNSATIESVSKMTLRSFTTSSVTFSDGRRYPLKIPHNRRCANQQQNISQSISDTNPNPNTPPKVSPDNLTPGPASESISPQRCAITSNGELSPEKFQRMVNPRRQANSQRCEITSSRRISPESFQTMTNTQSKVTNSQSGEVTSNGIISPDNSNHSEVGDDDEDEVVYLCTHLGTRSNVVKPKKIKIEKCDSSSINDNSPPTLPPANFADSSCTACEDVIEIVGNPPASPPLSVTESSDSLPDILSPCNEERENSQAMSKVNTSPAKASGESSSKFFPTTFATSTPEMTITPCLSIKRQVLKPSVLGKRINNNALIYNNKSLKGSQELAGCSQRSAKDPQPEMSIQRIFLPLTGGPKNPFSTLVNKKVTDKVNTIESASDDSNDISMNTVNTETKGGQAGQSKRKVQTTPTAPRKKADKGPTVNRQSEMEITRNGSNTNVVRAHPYRNTNVTNSTKGNRENQSSSCMMDYDYSLVDTENVYQVMTKRFDPEHYNDRLPKPNNLRDLLNRRETELLKGIQGDNNFIESLLFSMFFFTNIFDDYILDPNDCCRQKFMKTLVFDRTKTEKRNLLLFLRQEITLRARKYQAVPQKTVTVFMMLLQHLNPQLTGVLDISVYERMILTTLLDQALDLKEFINYTQQNKLPEYFHEMILDRSEKSSFISVQLLIDKSFCFQRIQLKDVPRPALILKMPEYYSSNYYKAILPNTVLDITDIICWAPRQCIICGDLAKHECLKCFDDGLTPYPSMRSTAYCDPCHHIVHTVDNRQHHFDSSNPTILLPRTHKDLPSPMKNFPEASHRITLKLLAIICVRYNNYCVYIKSGNSASDRWFLSRSRSTHSSGLPEIRQMPKEFGDNLDEFCEDKSLNTLRENFTMIKSEDLKEMLSSIRYCIYIPTTPPEIEETCPILLKYQSTENDV